MRNFLICCLAITVSSRALLKTTSNEEGSVRLLLQEFHRKCKSTVDTKSEKTRMLLKLIPSDAKSISNFDVETKVNAFKNMKGDNTLYTGFLRQVEQYVVRPFPHIKRAMTKILPFQQAVFEGERFKRLEDAYDGPCKLMEDILTGLEAIDKKLPELKEKKQENLEANHALLIELICKQGTECEWEEQLAAHKTMEDHKPLEEEYKKILDHASAESPLGKSAESPLGKIRMTILTIQKQQKEFLAIVDEVREAFHGAENMNKILSLLETLTAAYVILECESFLEKLNLVEQNPATYRELEEFISPHFFPQPSDDVTEKDFHVYVTDESDAQIGLGTRFGGGGEKQKIESNDEQKEKQKEHQITDDQIVWALDATIKLFKELNESCKVKRRLT
eukprot:GHVL01041693.1.p1 GENE.GHVL01041693.1~~GHVL01041693.1.p1  ORF type:complete len:402 (+),score=64.25 GHVL01041693.1:33-1208(+)